jgi:hypothetical protein
MRRRISIALGLALAATFAVAGLSAPANASSQAFPVYPGYVLYQTFGWPEACSSDGYAGQQSGQWKAYFCDEVDPPSYDAPGLINLYVSY